MESSSTVAVAGAYLGGLREVALSQPDQVAIIHGEQQLTFAELGALVAATAANLADALERSPLSPGSFVPVLVAHDIPSVVLIHAGFRAGAPVLASQSKAMAVATFMISGTSASRNTPSLTAFSTAVANLC